MALPVAGSGCSTFFYAGIRRILAGLFAIHCICIVRFDHAAGVCSL